MSFGRINLGGEEQEYKERKSYVIDTKEESEILKKENDTNGYNLVVEPPKLKKRPTEKYDKKDISVTKGKTASEQINKMVKSEEQYVAEEGIKNLHALNGSIQAITAIFGDEMPMPKKDKKNKISKEALDKCRADTDLSCMTIAFMYNKLIMNIDKCLENKNGETDNDSFKDVLNELKQQCEKERETFKDKALQYQSLFIKDSKKKGKNPRWVEALEYARGEYYDLDSPDYSFIQDRTGSASEVFGIEDKKNKKKIWFNKNVNVPPSDRAEMIRELFEDTSFKTLSDQDVESLKGVFTEMYVKNDKGVLYKNLREAGERTDADGYISFVKNRYKPKKGQKGNPMYDFLKNLKDDKKKEVHELLDGFCRRELTKRMAYAGVGPAKIKPNSSMSNRHVATSRMAGLLGIQNIVCDSRTAYAKQGDNLIKGNVMEDSGGITCIKAGFQSGNMYFSMDCIAQLFMLQALDAINGQTDRHHGNIHLLMENGGGISGIRAIDNNMSHGETTMKDMCSISYNKVKPINNLVISALPTWFVNKIFNIQKPVLELVFADVLEKSEIDAMWNRIRDFQAMIAKCFKYDMKYREEMAKRDGFYRDVYLKYSDEYADDNKRMLVSMKKMAEKDQLKYTNIPRFLCPSEKEISNAIQNKNARYLECPDMYERSNMIYEDR